MTALREKLASNLGHFTYFCSHQQLLNTRWQALPASVTNVMKEISILFNVIFAKISCLDTDMDDMLPSLLQETLSRESLLLRELLHLVSVWAVYSFTKEDIDHSSSCSHLVLTYISTVSGMQTCSTPATINRLQSGDDPVDICHLCRFLRALCHIRKSKAKSARKHLSACESVISWQPYIVFLNAYSHYLSGDVASCISSLQTLPTSQLTNSSPPIRVRLLNLAATCLSHEGNRALSVEKLKESYMTDLTHLHTLYLLSEEYRMLKLADKHLETLHSLIQALQKRNDQRVIGPRSLCQVLENLVISCDRTNTNVSLHQAQYLLAKALLHYERYTDSVNKYQELLIHIKQATHLDVTDKDCVKLPSMHQIYGEACVAALRAGRYDDCIRMASQGLDQSLGRDEFGDAITARCISGSTAARLAEAQLLMYKADAHQEMDEFHEAVPPLTAAIDILEQLKNTSSTDILLDPAHHKSTEISTPSKISDGAPMESGATNTGSVATPLVDSYCMLGTVYHKLREDKSALHYYRQAQQISSDNPKTTYNITAILTQMGRTKEAAVGWLQFRGTNHDVDSFQLANEIKRKTQDIKLLKERDASASDQCTVVDHGEVSQQQLLQLDINCLRHLMHHS